jgi:hypothetical protein
MIYCVMEGSAALRRLIVFLFAWRLDLDFVV